MKYEHRTYWFRTIRTIKKLDGKNKIYVRKWVSYDSSIFKQVMLFYYSLNEKCP